MKADFIHIQLSATLFLLLLKIGMLYEIFICLIFACQTNQFHKEYQTFLHKYNKDKILKNPHWKYKMVLEYISKQKHDFFQKYPLSNH